MEVSSLLVEKSQLEASVLSLISARAGKKQTREQLEMKLAEQRSAFQFKPETEHKNNKDAVKVEGKSAQEPKDNATVSKLEAEINKLRDKLVRTEQQTNTAEEEIVGLRKNVDNDKLILLLKKANEKEDKLANTLRDETKIKMDVFSPLGISKHDHHIREHMLCEKDQVRLPPVSSSPALLPHTPPLHRATNTPVANTKENEELVRSRELDNAKEVNVGDNEELNTTIPQYDGGDDLKITFCDICNQEFAGKNCVRNKKNHLILYHFKRKIEERIQGAVNGQYLCNEPSCDFTTNRKPDIRLHLASKHGYLDLLLKEHLEENTPMRPGVGQATVQAVSDEQPSPSTSASVLQPRSSSSWQGQGDINSRGQAKDVTLARRVVAPSSTLTASPPSQTSQTVVLTRQEEDTAIASITEDKKDEENKHVNKTSIRIVFSTGAIYLVDSNCGQTVRNVVTRLCDKQRPKVTNFHVYITGNNKVLNLSEDCSSLGGFKLRVEAISTTADNQNPEQQSAPVMEKICNIGQDRKHETIHDEVCDNIPSRPCSMVTGLVCSGVSNQECKVSFSYIQI